MDPIQAIVLALVQGLSEFLPISSSGHLILVPYFLGWPDQGLAFDVAVHIGTLLAVLVYFRHQLWTLITAWFGLRRVHTRDSRLALSGLACIHFLIRFIERIGLLPFTIYRLLLAAVIVALFA